MTILNNCPCCKGSAFNEFIKCKDFTVSGEIFTIVNCTSCGFKFTNPRPENAVIGNYYKAESYISHSDTKQGLVSKLYHLVRNYTLKKKLSLVSKYVSRGTIIDFGCGTGMFLKTCLADGWKVFGMEPDADARQVAARNNIKAFSGIRDLKSALGDTKADAITLWHVLEHIGDLDEALSFFNSSLNDQGVLIIAVPNYTSYDANYYKAFWAAYDVPRHLYHFEINSISRLMKGYGFSLIHTHPMKFDSFYVSMLSEKYKTGSVRYLHAFLTGLKSNLKAGTNKDYSSVIYVFKKST